MRRLFVCAIILASAVDVASAQNDLAAQILTVKRVYVDKLTGGETAAQMRDLLISSLQGAKLFVLTENAERADAFLRGAAEDLVYTDAFSSSEGVRVSAGEAESSGNSTGSRVNGTSSTIGSRSSRRMNIGVGENESTNIKE